MRSIMRYHPLGVNVSKLRKDNIMSSVSARDYEGKGGFYFLSTCFPVPPRLLGDYGYLLWSGGWAAV